MLEGIIKNSRSEIEEELDNSKTAINILGGKIDE